MLNGYVVLIVSFKIFLIKPKLILVFAVQVIQHVTCDPVKEYLLPVAEKLRVLAEKAYKEEERMRTHPDDTDEGTVAEDNARLVRDVYAFFPVIIFKLIELNAILAPHEIYRSS